MANDNDKDKNGRLIRAGDIVDGDNVHDRPMGRGKVYGVNNGLLTLIWDRVPEIYSATYSNRVTVVSRAKAKRKHRPGSRRAPGRRATRRR